MDYHAQARKTGQDGGGREYARWKDASGNPACPMRRDYAVAVSGNPSC